MEENNINTQVEEDELSVESNEVLDDEELDDETEEDEYNFNDEEEPEEVPEDPSVDDADDEEEETDDADEAGEAGSADAADVPEDGADSEQTAPEQSDAMRATMVKLLDRLGYHGTFEEAMAAYEADEAQKAAQAAEETNVEDKPADYAEMAARSLRDINAAFGTAYTDFTQFDDLYRFAELMQGGATAVEAFRATQKAIPPSAEQEEMSTVPGKPSKDHLKALPTSGTSSDGLSFADRQTLRELQELYPNHSKKDLLKTLNRVKRARA